MISTTTGFLVVLNTPESRGESGIQLNPRYSGVNRAPSYPPEIAEETDALYDYVFGDLKSDSTNLIPDLATAQHLMHKLSSSPREFEIILCCPGPSEMASQRLQPYKVISLGYDVALLKGDGWSIVGDFAASEWAKPYLSWLNEHGLFHGQFYALEYLRAYRDHKEPDAEMPFEVVFVARVIDPTAPACS